MPVGTRNSFWLSAIRAVVIRSIRFWFGSRVSNEKEFQALAKQADKEIEKELKYEKELLGFYLSNNPLAKYEKDFIELSSIDSEGINRYGGEKVQVGGIILSAQLRYDKNGNQWAIVSLETYSGNLQVYVFHNTMLTPC